MIAVGDPIRAGLVTNLARPAGNVTGLSLLIQELWGKRLELLRELVPRVSRVAFLHAGAVAGETALKEIQAASPQMRIDVRPMLFRGPDALSGQFQELRDARIEALAVTPSPDVDEARARIAELALRHGLPSIFAFREYAVAGGLMSYGSNLRDAHRRAATYVDRILKGAVPGDLPIEQALKFELVLNLSTAKALGLAVPQSLLLRADELVE